MPLRKTPLLQSRKFLCFLQNVFVLLYWNCPHLIKQTVRLSYQHQIAKFDEIGMLCEKTPLEILEESKNMITCYSLRYLLTSIRYHVQSTCLKIAEHPLFEATILLIILANCVILALDDPTVTTQDQWQIRADYVFQALYTAEIAIKVLGMGFMLGEEAYLKDPWNILDFTIVVFGYLSMFNLGGGVDLKALRTFRVLRPLRTVSSVEGLRVLISALVTSLPPLMDTLIILLMHMNVHQHIRYVNNIKLYITLTRVYINPTQSYVKYMYTLRLVI
eukprot:TRINITY_DN139_c0_g2_i4.p1 TRINITY_DN139_c0_g2~~TRINITY_DN139_c0_g2_i4.p1  ORF type:complete len:275 (-),score=-15.64 TRINITY_DN139_c0_g2_i4:431-1255(-)